MQPRCEGGSNDALLARLGPGGALLILSTVLGRNGEDIGFAVAAGPGDDAFLTGLTAQPALSGGTDAFVARIAATPGGPPPTPPGGPASPVPTLSGAAVGLFAVLLRRHGPWGDVAAVGSRRWAAFGRLLAQPLQRARRPRTSMWTKGPWASVAG